MWDWRDTVFTHWVPEIPLPRDLPVRFSYGWDRLVVLAVGVALVAYLACVALLHVALSRALRTPAPRQGSGAREPKAQSAKAGSGRASGSNGGNAAAAAGPAGVQAAGDQAAGDQAAAPPPPPLASATAPQVAAASVAATTGKPHVQFRTRRICGVLPVGALTAAILVASAAWFYSWTESLCFSRVDDPWASTGGVPITEVPELAHDELHRIVEFKARGLPAVVRGALNVSRDVNLAEWTPDALAELFGGHQLEVQLGNVEQGATELVDVDLGDFLRGIQDEAWVEERRRGDGRVPYVAESEDLFEMEPSLMVQALRLLDAVGLRDSRFLHFQHLFWMGPKGAVTGLHSDIDPLNVLYQMYGDKTLWLYPVTETPLLYESDKYDYGASLSRVDPFGDVNFTQFPDFAKAAALPVQVHAGDLLFVPAHWYHYARADSVVISVSVRLLTPCESASLAPWIVREMLHEAGVYRPAAGCVCHSSSDPDSPGGAAAAPAY